MPELAVAVLGPDRPGVVAALTDVLLGEGGNLEDTSMTILRGQFAMTLVVDVPLTAGRVRADLADVAARLDLLVSVREVAAGAEEPPDAAPYVLRVHGADRPGLVHRLTALLAAFDVNITDLTTRLVAGGGYVMIVSCDVPAGADIGALVAGVDRAAAELGVDATLLAADDDVL